MRRLFLLALLGLATGGCADGPPDGEALIQRAREAHGSARLDHAIVEFGLGADRFRVEHDDGRFAYTRVWTDRSGAVVHDVLTNDGLARSVDGRPAALDSLQRREAEAALRSAVYLALLPHPLADPAVQPRAIGRDTLASAPYERVMVTFSRASGGRDWRDRLVLWLHAERHTLDYLAYRFHGHGARFRAAYDPRTVGGVRFADFYEFSADLLEVPVEELGRRYERGELRFISRVELDGVQVQPLR